MNKKNALVAGATGLVGRHVLELLLEQNTYGNVIAFGRRKPELEHPRLISLTGDLNKPEKALDGYKIDDIYCCLGTTLKKAGSRPAFFKVDYEYAVSLAEYALDNGAGQFLLVSSIGADMKSSSFYLRVKGQLENMLKTLNYRGIHILRPSLLTGERRESRPVEKYGKIFMCILSPLMLGPLEKYKPVHADVVASAMISIGTRDIPGVFIYESDEIRVIGDDFLIKQKSQ
jgi:uncharacterized protein YbjT (DUF2867 family)